LLAATFFGCQARVGQSPGSAGYDAFACPDGFLCDGTPVTGSPGQTVCGDDLEQWTCTSSGWQALGTPCTCGGGGAGTFFVSPSGSDDNPGTLEAPFQTIAHARDVVRGLTSAMTDDVVVVLRGGTYTQSDTLMFDARDSGQNGYDIVY